MLTRITHFELFATFFFARYALTRTEEDLNAGTDSSIT